MSFSELHCDERWFPSREGIKTAFTIPQFLSAENLIIVNLDRQEGYGRANSDPIVLKLSDNYRILAKNGQKHFLMTYTSRFFLRGLSGGIGLSFHYSGWFLFGDFGQFFDRWLQFQE